MIRLALCCAAVLSFVLALSPGSVIPQARTLGVTQPIALAGDAVPEGNGDFSSFSSTPALSSAGLVAFLAGLKNTSGIAANRNGIDTIELVDSYFRRNLS